LWEIGKANARGVGEMIAREGGAGASVVTSSAIEGGSGANQESGLGELTSGGVASTKSGHDCSLKTMKRKQW
jgi:hypothetical protein